MRFLSKILFYLSSFSILPPEKSKQLEIIETVEKKNVELDNFLKNSVCQYDCQSFYFLKLHWWGFNIFSTFTVPFLFLVLLMRPKRAKPNGLKDVSLYPKIPNQIRDSNNPIYVKKPFGYLKKRDLKYIVKIFLGSGWRPYFVFRSIWKLAVYSELMDTYNPERIWVTQEMVFESSLLTSYLSDFRINHINFMHGDNYFSIQTAFSSFHQFYVWDEYYVELFKSLRCQVGQYHTFLAVDRLTSNFTEKNVIKYYNQDSREKKKFNKVLDNLVKFSEKNHCEVVVRLHPLHKKKFELETLNARGIKIESNDLNIIDSISEAKFVCSEFSSVLYQATLLNKTIVIDNSYPERIELISKINVIFNKNIPLLYLVTSEEKSRI